MKKLLFLTIFLLFTNGLQAQYTNITYSVQQIPFNLHTLPLQAGTLFLDDQYSSQLNIGFSFNFFVDSYNKVLIGDNGIISFDMSKAGNLCHWEIQNTIPDTYSEEKNAVYGVYQDTYIPSGGNIKYSQIGTAPFRKFVALYDNISLYACNNTKMTSQIVLYETYNFIDVQIGERTPCTTWNSGNGILGIINITGQNAYTPPGRNTGSWTTLNEAWRFKPNQSFPDYQYILCDTNLDGIETFDLNQIINHYTGLLYTSVSLHPTYSDAVNDTNNMSGNYVNTSNAQSLYVRLDNAATPEIRRVILAAIDCNVDYDSDNIPTNTEDLNGNGNFGDDDSDGDGIPNFVDDDDDGDMVLTQFEPISLDTDLDGTPNYLDIDDDGDGILTIFEDVALPHTYPQDVNPMNDDTDGDGIPNYLDIDDDDDGILTINEHPDDNQNYEPEGAWDTNNNGIPDYLDPALGANPVLSKDALHIYPIPAKDFLHIDFNIDITDAKMKLFTQDGKMIQQEMLHTSQNLIQLPETKGIYYLKILTDKGEMNKPIIIK